MNSGSLYSQHHPRWLRRPMSTYWWLGRWPYVKFILRELSSIFVAWFVIYLLLLVHAVSGGALAYQRFLEWSGTTVILTLNVTTLFFVVFHALTWFALAPQAMVVHAGKKRVPPVLIAASNYAAWLVASAFVAWLLLRDPQIT